MAALIRGCQPALQQLRAQLRATSAFAGRGFATAAPAGTPGSADQEGDDDPVMAAFKLQQSAYRQIIEGLQNIDIPLAGDAAAIRKFADEVEALKKKAGYPDYQEIADAQIAHTMAQSSSYAQFLTAATEGKNFGENQGAINEMIAAAQSAEEESGEPLTEDNEQGQKLYSKALEGIKAKYGFQDVDKARREAIYNMYEGQIAELRETVIEATETAKRQSHLEHIDVDLSAIKPKWERA